MQRNIFFLFSHQWNDTVVDFYWKLYGSSLTLLLSTQERRGPWNYQSNFKCHFIATKQLLSRIMKCSTYKEMYCDRKLGLAINLNLDWIPPDRNVGVKIHQTRKDARPTATYKWPSSFAWASQTAMKISRHKIPGHNVSFIQEKGWEKKFPIWIILVLMSIKIITVVSLAKSWFKKSPKTSIRVNLPKS